MSPAKARRFVAYYRVSTDKQGKSGLGLEAQRAAVLAFLNGGAWELVAEYTETESGKRNDRPELAGALEACRRHKARLVIAKLDRLSRNLAFIAALMDSAVEFVAVDNPHASRLTLHILAAVAEHEREMISARTKAALEAARSRGTRLGNPRPGASLAHGRAAQRAAAHRFAVNVLPVILDIERAGASTLAAIATALNGRGVPTARGGEWTHVQVSSILDRCRA